MNSTRPTPKIVLNGSAGVFSLSDVAIEKISSRKANVDHLQILPATKDLRQRKRPVAISNWLTVDRTDPDLVSIVEELGLLANGPNAELEIVVIPENPDWSIGDVCGIEFVSVAGQVWPPHASTVLDRTKAT